MSDGRSSAASAGAITFRLYPSTHAILKVMAGVERMTMVELLDKIVREEAERKGFRLRDERPKPPVLPEDMEIVVPIR